MIDWRTVRAVIFDMDGTLYDQKRLRKKLWLRLGQYYLVRPWLWREVHILSTFLQEREKLRSFQGKGLSYVQYQKVAGRLNVSLDRVQSVVERWMLKEPLQYLARYIYPGVQAFFQSLAERRIPTVIFSDFPVLQKVKVLGISPPYMLSATDREIDRFKPNPKGLEVAAEKLGISTDHCLFLGDRDQYDGECARRAGMPYLLLQPWPGSARNGYCLYRKLKAQLEACL